MISWMKIHLGWLVAGILGMFCIFFINAWIDARITITYTLSELDQQKKMTKTLRDLLQETGKQMSRTEIKQLVVKRFGKDHLIKEDVKDELSVDNIIIKFKGDALYEIKLGDGQ